MLRGKASLSWCSLYFHHTSFIYSNGPPISHYIHENHKAERVQTFFAFSVLIYNSSLLFFFFFASVVDHELSKQCYCKMINTWSCIMYQPLLQTEEFSVAVQCRAWSEQAQPFVQFEDVNRIFIPHIFYVDGVWTNQIFILSVLYETKPVLRHINF